MNDCEVLKVVLKAMKVLITSNTMIILEVLSTYGLVPGDSQ